MPTLAQRLRDEGKEKWMNEGRNEGIYEGKLETARRMLHATLGAIFIPTNPNS